MFQTPTGAWHTCDEVFIISLFRMMEGMAFTKMAEDIFGGDSCTMSHIYNYFVRFMDQKGEILCMVIPYPGLYHIFQNMQELLKIQ